MAVDAAYPSGLSFLTWPSRTNVDLSLSSNSVTPCRILPVTPKDGCFETLF